MKIIALERSDQDSCGGNSRFTAGAMRVAYNGVDDIKTLVPDLTEVTFFRLLTFYSV